MEYNITTFTNEIMRMFVNSNLMPDMGGSYTNRYGNTQSDESKHSKRPTPRMLKAQIANSMVESLIMGETQQTFEIGNADMETYFPYYHILQQAQVIRKRGRGTTKSKGSESLYQNKSERDYERVIWNGKTFTKEYSKNVRGTRSRIGKVSHWKDNVYVNESSNSYANIHYQYIDRILDSIVQPLADQFGMKVLRKQDSGLIDEFASQEGTSVDDILDIFESFME